MPVLDIRTNVAVPADRRAAVVADASQQVAHLLGKPEKYVMVLLEDGLTLSFGGDMAPAAFVQLLSLGLPEDQTPAFSAAVCAWLGEALGLPADRVYIAFGAPPRHMFGFNGGTF